MCSFYLITHAMLCVSTLLFSSCFLQSLAGSPFKLASTLRAEGNVIHYHKHGRWSHTRHIHTSTMENAPKSTFKASHIYEVPSNGHFNAENSLAIDIQTMVERKQNLNKHKPSRQAVIQMGRYRQHLKPGETLKPLLIRKTSQHTKEYLRHINKYKRRAYKRRTNKKRVRTTQIIKSKQTKLKDISKTSGTLKEDAKQVPYTNVKQAEIKHDHIHTHGHDSTHAHDHNQHKPKFDSQILDFKFVDESFKSTAKTIKTTDVVVNEIVTLPFNAWDLSRSPTTKSNDRDKRGINDRESPTQSNLPHHSQQGSQNSPTHDPNLPAQYMENVLSLKFWNTNQNNRKVTLPSNMKTTMANSIHMAHNHVLPNQHQAHLKSNNQMHMHQPLQNVPVTTLKPIIPITVKSKPMTTSTVATQEHSHEINSPVSKMNISRSDLVHLQGIHIMFSDGKQDTSGKLPTIHLSAHLSSAIQSMIPTGGKAEQSAQYLTKSHSQTPNSPIVIASTTAKAKPAEPAIDKIIGTAVIRDGHLYLVVYPIGDKKSIDVKFTPSHKTNTKYSTTGSTKRPTTKTITEQLPKNKPLLEPPKNGHFNEYSTVTSKSNLSPHSLASGHEHHHQLTTPPTKTTTTSSFLNMDHTHGIGVKPHVHKWQQSLTGHSEKNNEAKTVQPMSGDKHNMHEHDNMMNHAHGHSGHHDHMNNGHSATEESGTKDGNPDPIQRFLSPWNSLNLSTIFPQFENVTPKRKSDDDNDVSIVSFIAQANDPFDKIKKIIATLSKNNTNATGPPSANITTEEAVFNFEVKLEGNVVQTTLDSKQGITEPLVKSSYGTSPSQTEKATTEGGFSSGTTTSVYESDTVSAKSTYFSSLFPSALTTLPGAVDQNKATSDNQRFRSTTFPFTKRFVELLERAQVRNFGRHTEPNTRFDSNQELAANTDNTIHMHTVTEPTNFESITSTERNSAEVFIETPSPKNQMESYIKKTTKSITDTIPKQLVKTQVNGGDAIYTSAFVKSDNVNKAVMNDHVRTDTPVLMSRNDPMANTRPLLSNENNYNTKTDRSLENHHHNGIMTTHPSVFKSATKPIYRKESTIRNNNKLDYLLHLSEHIQTVTVGTPTDNTKFNNNVKPTKPMFSSKDSFYSAGPNLNKITTQSLPSADTKQLLSNIGLPTIQSNEASSTSLREFLQTDSEKMSKDISKFSAKKNTKTRINIIKSTIPTIENVVPLTKSKNEKYTKVTKKLESATSTNIEYNKHTLVETHNKSIANNKNSLGNTLVDNTINSATQATQGATLKNNNNIFRQNITPAPPTPPSRGFQERLARGQSEHIMSLADILNDIRRIQLENMQQFNIQNNNYNTMLFGEAEQTSNIRTPVVLDGPVFNSVTSTNSQMMTANNNGQNVGDNHNVNTNAQNWQNNMNNQNYINNAIDAMLVLSVDDILSDHTTLHGAIVMSQGHRALQTQQSSSSS